MKEIKKEEEKEEIKEKKEKKEKKEELVVREKSKSLMNIRKTKLFGSLVSRKSTQRNKKNSLRILEQNKHFTSQVANSSPNFHFFDQDFISTTVFP